MDFGDYLRLVRRSAWIIIALVLVGVLGASVLSLREEPVYGSTATGFVSARSTTITDLGQVTVVSQQTAKNFAGIATSSLVLQQVISELDLKVSPAQLANRVVASVATDSNVLTISAYAPTADESARIANAVMRRIGSTIQALLPGSSGSQINLRLTVVNPAVAPATPESPKPLRDIAFGALIGLFLGLVVAVLRQVLDSRVTTLHDLERQSDRPVLGLFTKDERPPRQASSDEDFVQSSGAEAFRTLRTNLRFLEGPGGSQSFVVTSPGADEDRAKIAANLAIAIADLGTRVIVVDADLRKAGIGAYLGVSEKAGLTDVVRGRASLQSAVQRWGDTLHVLPAGAEVPNPNEFVQSAAMHDLVVSLQMQYDAVILNTPPLLVASDAAVIATYTRGALLVCELDRTKRAGVQAAFTALDRVGSSVLGLVATGLRESVPASYGRGGRKASGAQPLFQEDEAGQPLGTTTR